MSLSAGTRLGSYEIVGPLGAGAMGVVYRARDPRLGRSVAIKIMAERSHLEPEARQRFEREARAASAIAHPNIVTVHEIGESDGAPYIVMELVEGRSLRELLSDGPLPTRTLLSIAAQIADGLAAAHQRGIVHRDLKPENLMVTPGGAVKILDFGLARPTARTAGPDESTLASPLRMTEPGIVFGTVSYMSPEQARGEEVDFRTDQFSLGTVLFELATGKVPFKRASAAETMTAIIREEPLPLRELTPGSPAPFRWIVERCLAKEREGRYDSTLDLARELHSLKDHLSEVGAQAAAVDSATRGLRIPQRGAIAAMTVLGLVAISAVGLALKWRSPRSLPTFRRLTFQRGNVTGARFGPDGQTVVYSAAWEGRPSELFTTHLSGPGFRTLGVSPAWIAGVSDTGEIALRYTQNVDDLGAWFTGTLALVPLSGGTPREIRERVTSADISRDGKSLAVVSWADTTGAQLKLEYPLGTKLASGLFNRPRISPDGRLVAVIDVKHDGEKPGFRISTFDRQGNRKVLSFGWRLALGPVWSPRGDEVWFTAGDGLPQTVMAADLSGRTRELLRIPPIVALEDVAPDGRVLLKRQDLQSGIFCQPPGETTEKDLSWLGNSELADISRDGKTVLFTAKGAGKAKAATYVRKTDGSPATRLGDGSAIALSLDGKWALAEHPDQSHALVLLPVGPDEPRKLDLGANRFGGLVGWSPDGARLFYLAIEADQSFYLHELTLASGQDRKVASHMLIKGSLSPDGTAVAGCEGGFLKCAVYPLDGRPPRPIPGREEGLSVVGWTPDGRSVYVSDHGMPLRISLVRISDGHTEMWKELRPADGAGISQISSFSISPATGAYAYSYERILSELHLVEGLR